jgi:hypothetical protein
VGVAGVYVADHARRASPQHIGSTVAIALVPNAVTASLWIDLVANTPTASTTSAHRRAS